MRSWWPDALGDLLTGSACLGCDRPGRLVCPACRAGLPDRATPVRPTPCPEGLARCLAAGEYDGLLRTLVIGHKEHRMLGLTAMLGRLLALAAAAAVAGREGPVVLVPVPSSPATVRARGHDHADALVRSAAGRLRDEGLVVARHRLLSSRGPVADQSGLDRVERAANVSGSLHCQSPALRRLRRWSTRALVLVCDDVLTTGATAREAQRALEASGVPVLAVATVAATRRRSPGATDRPPS